MKFNYKIAMVLALTVVGLSLQARRGGGGGGHRGGGGGHRGGGWHRGGGRGWGGRGYGYRRGYYGRGFYPGVGFAISSAPRVYNDCVYAAPSASYYSYKRQFTDPIKDQNGYYTWLRNNNPNWQSDWNQFQAYLDYRACNKPQVGVSIGVGGGYGGYGYRRGWGW